MTAIILGHPRIRNEDLLWRRTPAEMTVLGGQVMWDLNGRAGTDWKSFKYVKRSAKP